MIKLLIGPWKEVFLEEQASCSKIIRIISPFISKDAIELLNPSLKNMVSVQLITRLNDRDFLAGVSDIEALLAFSRNGGEVCGQSRVLHSKVFIFDDSRAIVTSGNLTSTGLGINSEIGVCLDKSGIVLELVDHFKTIWEKLAPAVDCVHLKELSDHVKLLKLKTSGERKEPPGIKDHGKEIQSERKRQAAKNKNRLINPRKGFSHPSRSDLRRAWVKFAWRRSDPADRDEPVHTYGNTSCAITFPESPGHPNEINTGDLVYHAALTNSDKGRDWIVYAKGSVACAHRRGIDELPQETRRKYPNVGRYPYLAWLYNVDLIGKDLSHGISLRELFDELGDHTFVWSKERADNGDPNRHVEAIRYHRSHIELTPAAVDLLDAKLEATFEKTGKIHKDSGNDVWWNNEISDPKLKFRKTAI